MKCKTTQLSTVVVVFVVSLMLVAGCDVLHPKEKTINVIFRYDDYSTLSNTGIELKIIDIFRANNDPITFGVIPYVAAANYEDPTVVQDVIPLNLEKGEILREGKKEGILDIALHGYSHQTITPRPFSEFKGLDYDNQYKRLVKGKALLEGIIGTPVTVFVPPWNRYDQNTVLALEALGFSAISASTPDEVIDAANLDFLSTPCPLTKRKDCIVSVPATCSLYHLKDCVAAGRKTSLTQPTIVILIHAYDFKEVDEVRGFTSIQEFSDSMSWLHSQNNIKILSIRQIKQEIFDKCHPVLDGVIPTKWISLNCFK